MEEQSKFFDRLNQYIEKLEDYLQDATWTESFLLKRRKRELEVIVKSLKAAKADVEEQIQNIGREKIIARKQGLTRVPDGCVVVYILLNIRNGRNIEDWEQAMEALPSCGFGRPMYMHEEQARRAVHAQGDSLRSGYVALYVHKDDILDDEKEFGPYGQHVINLKPGAIDSDHVVSFVHYNQEAYLYIDKKLVVDDSKKVGHAASGGGKESDDATEEAVYADTPQGDKGGDTGAVYADKSLGSVGNDLEGSADPGQAMYASDVDKVDVADDARTDVASDGHSTGIIQEEVSTDASQTDGGMKSDGVDADKASSSVDDKPEETTSPGQVVYASDVDKEDVANDAGTKMTEREQDSTAKIDTADEEVAVEKTGTAQDVEQIASISKDTDRAQKTDAGEEEGHSSAMYQDGTIDSSVGSSDDEESQIKYADDSQSQEAADNPSDAEGGAADQGGQVKDAN